MCGINGIFSLSEIMNLENRIVSMNKSISHRGPDADKFIIIKNRVGLGHRRLSILDIDERSNQPMQLYNGKYIVVYNGEIFNFKEIRSRLDIEYNFKTASDTEVLLAAIEFKGIDWFLNMANGMFAFAVFNTQTNELILARDRFGIKPLFYTIVEDKLVFSSEIKGILNSGLVQAEFCEDSIDDYLANRYSREPFTFFKNIFQVKSATYIKFSNNLTTKEIKYWELPRLNFNKEYDLNAVIDKTDYEIQAAFKRWFIADVKVGAYLSGGVDSSLTTAILTQYSNKSIDTYTIGFEEKGYNEFPYSRQVSEIYGTKHHEIKLSKSDYLDNWDKLIYFKDAPLAVPNEIPLAKMSSILSRDITVVISGEGADELFGGYGRIFRSAFDYKNLKLQNPFYDYFIDKYDYVPRNIRDKYLLQNNKRRNYFDQQIINEFNKFSNEENIFRFFHQYHIKGLLQRVDMTTMQTSVEARPPFLDHKLIEYVYKEIPYSLKLHWNNVKDKQKAKLLSSEKYSEVLDAPKYILKKVAENYLPNDIIYRKKMGFPVPLTNWFPKLELLSQDILPGASWLNQDGFKELLNELKSNDRSGQLLWMFINIQKFYLMYFKKNWLW